MRAGFPTFVGGTNNQTDTAYEGRSDMLRNLVDGTTNLNTTTNVVPCRLGYWRFDTPDLISEYGQRPISATNVTLVPSWSGTALNVSESGASGITYADVGSNGWANINCRQGTVRFWFKPNWTGSLASTPFLGFRAIRLHRLANGHLGTDSTGSAITFITASNGISETHCRRRRRSRSIPTIGVRLFSPTA